MACRLRIFCVQVPCCLERNMASLIVYGILTIPFFSSLRITIWSHCRSLLRLAGCILSFDVLSGGVGNCSGASKTYSENLCRMQDLLWRIEKIIKLRFVEWFYGKIWNSVIVSKVHRHFCFKNNLLLSWVPSLWVKIISYLILLHRRAA